MNMKEIKENKLKMILGFSIPSIIAMLLQTVITITDGYFTGNYHNLPKEWCAFIEKYEYLATEETIYIECTIDDPSITDENNCMYELCQTISPEHPVLKENADIFTHSFEGGKYAVYHFKGFPQFSIEIVERKIKDSIQILQIGDVHFKRKNV